MIKFPCLCRHNFAVEEEMAGREIQCPKCGRLNDVPTLDELKNFTPEGTYQIGVEPLPTERGRVDHLRRVYTRSRSDVDGSEIDLRGTIHDIKKVMPLESEYALMGEAKAGKKTAPPKYDPVTGELIRPLEIVQDSNSVPVGAIPMARAVLGYARGELSPESAGWYPLVELLKPINLAVMLFVLIGHLCILAMFVPMQVWMPIIFPMIILFCASIAPHYANVIEEIGPEQKDELPRLFRNMSLIDDFWMPFVRICVAFGYSFGSGLLAFAFVPLAWKLPLLLLLSGLGAIVFPAALMTTVTSGNLESLRPDRVLGLIATIGVRYMFLLGLFWVAFAVYGLGIVGTGVNLNSLFMSGGLPGFLSHGPVSYGALLLGIYLMHAFSWYMGLTYRAHHQNFPWALQRFERLTPRESVAVHQAQKAVQANTPLEHVRRFLR